MANQYLDQFYSYKWVAKDASPVSQKKSVAAMDFEERERRKNNAKALIEDGNELFYQEKFQLALNNYSRARNLIFGLLSPGTEHIFQKDFKPEMKANIFDHLMSGAIEAAKSNSTEGWREKNVSSTMIPPAEFFQDVNCYTGQKISEKEMTADFHRRLGEWHVLSGQPDKGIEQFDLALKLTGDSQKIAGVKLALGSTYLLKDDTQKALPLLEEAKDRFKDLKMDFEHKMTINNMDLFKDDPGMVMSSAGGEIFGASGLDPVMEAIDIGQASGKHILFPTADKGLPVEISVDEIGQALHEMRKTLLVTIVDEKLAVDLEKLDAAEVIKEKIYEERISSDSLNGLNLAGGTDDDFYAAIPHLYYFSLPMSMADCYYEMGDYENAAPYYCEASTYQYLNQEIEVPLVWGKLASTYLKWGNLLYRGRNILMAKSCYEKIVKIVNDVPEVSNDPQLYRSPVFDGMRQQAEAVLSEYDNLNYSDHNLTIAEPVVMAVLNLLRIEHDIYLPLLSFEREQIPVFRFEYLKKIARYFTEQVVRTQRGYIDFKTKAEEEEFEQSMLENAMSLAVANENLEIEMVNVAQAQLDTLNANCNYVSTQLENAQASRDHYYEIGRDQAELEALIATVLAPRRQVVTLAATFSEYDIDTGRMSVQTAVSNATRRRALNTRSYETMNMNRHIDNLFDAERVAEAQRVVAEYQLNSANLRLNIATMRSAQAEAMLEQFNNEEFTPELWNRLAMGMKSLSWDYLYLAIGFAQLMERAFEFEFGYEVSFIQESYYVEEYSGLLAGELLLRDIDNLTFHQVVIDKKVSHVKEVISLSEWYPYQFLKDFRRKGRMSFNVDLLDLDAGYPGAYMRKIRRMEVVVEGIIPPRGVKGTLTNTGVSFSRLRYGGKRLRLLKPETMLLSEYRTVKDAIVFPIDPEKLGHFELAPVATSWVLDLPPWSNDLNYDFITDVKLVVYYDTFYSEALKVSVLEEIADQVSTKKHIRFGMKTEFAENFINMQETGEMEFQLDQAHFPFQHVDPKVTWIAAFFILEDDTCPENMLIEITAVDDDTSASARTTPDGMIFSHEERPEPLNAFVNNPLLQTWRIKVPQAGNQSLFNNGFTWSQISEIFFVTEYEFSPRSSGDGPSLVLLDNFEQNPMALFDVVDDPAAVNNGPSNWRFMGGSNTWMEQISTIHGGPADTSPEKPGTYLVRKISEEVPELKNLILKTRLTSTVDDGIGLVFRYQDVNNFYFFLMDEQLHYMRLGKKVNGIFEDFSPPNRDFNNTFHKGETYDVKVIARHKSIKVYIDGVKVLQGWDSTFEQPGRMGFYCWKNNGARFENLKIMSL